MTALVFERRFLADYARNRVNVFLLVLVPVVFVVVVAGSLAAAGKLLGGPGGPAVEIAAAGWAAAFLAGIAMYFQTAVTRDTDRRLIFAGLAPSRLVLARLLTGLCLAVLASVAALLALGLRTGINDPAHVIAGTLMFAVIYVAIGSAVGSMVANPVNGSVIVLFIWILDVFFGPAMGAADRVATRALPTHYVTLWMLDIPSGHSGRIGELGWALAWTLTAVLACWAIAALRIRSAHAHPVHRHRVGQLGAAFRGAWRDARRNPVQWALFVVVPVLFILIAKAVTPHKPIIVAITEHGRRLPRVFAMPDVHAATMAPIAVASLAALVGLFVMLDSTNGDRRTALAGLRPITLLTARLGVLALTALVATAVALATTALVFHPANWPVYAAANILIALTYGLVGALIAPAFGRVGGVFVAFLLPFLDLAIVQSPMLHPTPTTLSTVLPGYGGSRVLLDAALSRGFDETRPLLLALGWLAALAIAVALTYRHAVRPRQPESADRGTQRPGHAPGAVTGLASPGVNRSAGLQRNRPPQAPHRGVHAS